MREPIQVCLPFQLLPPAPLSSDSAFIKSVVLGTLVARSVSTRGNGDQLKMVQGGVPAKHHPLFPRNKDSDILSHGRGCSHLSCVNDSHVHLEKEEVIDQERQVPWPSFLPVVPAPCWADSLPGHHQSSVSVHSQVHPQAYWEAVSVATVELESGHTGGLPSCSKSSLCDTCDMLPSFKGRALPLASSEISVNGTKCPLQVSLCGGHPCTQLCTQAPNPSALPRMRSQPAGARA